MLEIQAKESIYFYKIHNELHQAIEIILTEVEDELEVNILLQQSGHEKKYVFKTTKGNNSFKVPIPLGGTLNVGTVFVSVDIKGKIRKFNVNIGNIKPWTIYVAQDKHLDYGWIHPVEDVIKRINDLTDYYIDLHEENGTKFNFDCTLWFEEYKNARPEARVKKLVDLLKSGEFEMGALYAIFFNGIMTEEEFIQSLIPALKLEKEYGIVFSTVLPTEVPSMNWGLPSILEGAGIKHIVRGAFDLNNANIRNREAYPLFYWEGPDGSRVLAKFDLLKQINSFGGYGEAFLLHIGSYEDRTEFIEEAVIRYQEYENYDFDAFMLAGTGWDQYPFNSETIDYINWYNSQDWEYPKIVDATWSDYWRYIEDEIEKGAKVPVLKGDFGSSWEEWPAQLAYVNSLYRQAREIVLMGQSASALAFMLSGKAILQREEELYHCFLNLNKFCDHNIGGILPSEADDMRDRKITYVYNAIKKGRSCLESALCEIAYNIKSDTSLLVFNSLSYQRDGIVRVVMPQVRDYKVVDTSNNENILCQIETKGVHPEHYLTFTAKNMPPFGLKIYSIIPVSEEKDVEKRTPVVSEGIIENRFFKLEIDSNTGGLKSFYDKRLNKELADKNSSHKLNQFMYTSEGQRYSINSVKITEGPSGEVCKSLIAEGKTYRSSIRITYTLYSELDIVDITNELHKDPSSELQSCHFIFPFNVPEREYHYDGAAAILKPGLKKYGGSQLPGAGMGTYSGTRFADVSNDEYGATLTSLDTHLYHFGSDTIGRTEGFIEPNNSTIYSLAMQNYNRNDYCLKQGGQEYFKFRYCINIHKGKFNASEALKFSKASCSPLETRNLRLNKKGAIDAACLSFIKISASNVITSGLKVSEDRKGIIIRLRECEGIDTDVEITCPLFDIRDAILVDLLEREKSILLNKDGVVKVSVPASGICAIKINTKHALS